MCRHLRCALARSRRAGGPHILQLGGERLPGAFEYNYVYIYIYIYTHMCVVYVVCIYIYIHISLSIPNVSLSLSIQTLGIIVVFITWTLETTYGKLSSDELCWAKVSPDESITPGEGTSSDELRWACGWGEGLPGWAPDANHDNNNNNNTNNNHNNNSNSNRNSSNNNNHINSNNVRLRLRAKAAGVGPDTGPRVD